MMKRLSFLLAIVCAAFIADAQMLNNVMKVTSSIGDYYYYLSDIDSITHSGNQANIHFGDEVNSISVNDISQMEFRYYGGPRLYEMDYSNLEGWEGGICDENECFIVYKEDVENDCYQFVIGQRGDPDAAISIVTDKDFNIESVVSTEGMYYIDEIDSKLYSIYVTADNIEIQEIDTQYRPCRSRLSLPSVGTIARGIGTVTSGLMTINDGAKLINDGRAYVPTFIANLAIPELGAFITKGGPLTSLAISVLLGQLETRYEEYFYYLLSTYTGYGAIEIIDTNTDNAPDCTATAQITMGLEPETPLTLDLYTGILVKEKSSDVTYHNKDYELQGHTFKHPHTYTAQLSARPNTAYYLRPYIAVLGDRFEPLRRQRYLFGKAENEFIIYGSVKKINYSVHIYAATGDVVSVDETTAVVECIYGGTSKYTKCYVEYKTDDSGWMRKEANNVSGSQKVTLSGLERATQYYYRAVIVYESPAATYTDEGSTIGFATDLPDISGAWSVVETRVSYNQTYYYQYTLILGKDGSTLSIEGNDETPFISGGWSLGIDGGFSAIGRTISTQTQDAWDTFSGTVNDIKNPTQIVGKRYRGFSNSVIGAGSTYYVGDIVMSR